ncbi:MAG: leucine-rich repeat protein, partial [Verrucomicrobiae bacterium]|nr:leucine-rich repeat protein [Verrucomicrobiae bacterium]
STYGMFEGCTNLTSVSLSSTVGRVDGRTFRGCPALESILVHPSNPILSSVDGVVYTSNLKTLVKWPNGKPGSLQLPDTVTKIEGAAFYQCAKLTSVTIPEGVLTIEDYFGTPSYCCEDLACGYLGTFEGCASLTSVTIPSTVHQIDPNSFRSCIALESISVAPSNPDFTSADGALFNEAMTVLLVYPSEKEGSYTVPNSVEVISDGAFLNCSKLTQISLPNGLSSIGDEAFSHCVSLTSVAIPDSVASLGKRVFSGCSGLDTVELGNGITSIEEGSFRGCTSLTSLAIPEGIVSISRFDELSVPDYDDGAFKDCTGLVTITLPESVAFIGRGTFKGCTSLKSFIVPAGVPYLLDGTFHGCTGLKSTLFLGDFTKIYSPQQVFVDVADEFTVYYLAGRSGFASEEWAPYSTVMLDSPPSALRLWSLENGFSLDADLNQDVNGDGISLIMAYALNLDPGGAIAEHLPSASLTSDGLVMTFYASSPDIEYAVQASRDLQNWSSVGVNLSEIGPDGRRTAIVTRDSQEGYLRLEVKERQ